MAQVPISQAMYQKIAETAQELGMPVRDLIAKIGYETGGTFDPMQSGPTTKWGQHRGLIQFGEPQAEQYGVDFSSPEAALNSQLGKDGAIVKYFRGSGYEPGMNFEQGYSTVNAGNPNRPHASDAHVGGAPGTVRDKVNSPVMQQHLDQADRIYSAYTGAPTNTSAQAYNPQRALAEHFMRDRDALDQGIGQVAENRVNDQRQLMQWVDPRNPMWQQFKDSTPGPMQGPNLPPMQGPQNMPMQGPNVPPSPAPRPQPTPGPTGQPTVSAMGPTQGPNQPPIDATGIGSDNYNTEPDKAPWYRTQAFGDALSALGVGLSQINNREAVNVMPHIAQIRQARASAAQAQAQQEQQEIENERDAQKFELEKAKFQQELRGQSGPDYSYAVDQFPELGGLAYLAAQGDDDAKREFASAYATALEQAGTMSGPEVANAASTYMSAATPQERLQAISSLPPAQQQEVIDLASKINPDAEKDLGAVRLAQAIQEREDAGDYAGADRIREAARLTSGTTLDDRVETAVALQRVERGNKMLDHLQNSSMLSSAPMPNVIAMDRANDEVLNLPGDTSIWADRIAGFATNVGSVFGDDQVEAFFSDYGFDLNALETIENESQALGLMVAKSMMEGQGSVTDAERLSMLKTIGGGGVGAEQRAQILARLQVLNEVDAEIYQYASSLDTGLREDAGNLREFSGFVNKIQSQVPSIATAAQNHRLFMKQSGARPVNTSKALPFSSDDDPETILRHMIPAVTPDVAQAMYKMLKRSGPNKGRLFVDQSTNQIREIMPDGKLVPLEQDT